MRFRNILIFLGFIAVILQFLGFPRAWDNVFYIAIGLLVMAFSYLSGKERRVEASEAAALPSVAPVESNA